MTLVTAECRGQIWDVTHSLGCQTEQDRPSTCNVTLRRVRATVVVVERK